MCSVPSHHALWAGQMYYLASSSSSSMASTYGYSLMLAISHLLRLYDTLNKEPDIDNYGPLHVQKADLEKVLKNALEPLHHVRVLETIKTHGTH
jgi:hypothetical protein